MEDKVEYSAEAEMTFPIPSNILPAPFEWVFIPKGNAVVNYVAPDNAPTKTVWVDDFYISKYTITNAQYQIYVEETGNIPERSSYWGRPYFNEPAQPVFDLRWQEAMLYCMWLSEKLGYQVTLPSYSQWNRAARGDSNDLYAWGNDWDATKCNCEQPRGHTMSVNYYENGQSRFGVFNMGGNVFEWCLTNSNTGLDTVDFPIVKTDLIPEKLLWSDSRIFVGSDYGSSFKHMGLTSHGAVTLWASYCTGIRLVIKG